MIVIKEIIGQMEDELNGASEYIEKAMKYKDTDKALADLYYNMSLAEKKHHDDLHAQVVRMIQTYRSQHGEPPKEMQAIYDWEHEKDIARMRDVKAMQDMYKS